MDGEMEKRKLQSIDGCQIGKTKIEKYKIPTAEKTHMDDGLALGFGLCLLFKAKRAHSSAMAWDPSHSFYHRTYKLTILG